MLAMQRGPVVAGEAGLESAENELAYSGAAIELRLKLHVQSTTVLHMVVL